MEEISSLDSFHTDGADDSTARPESETPKPDEETSQASAAAGSGKPDPEDEDEEETADETPKGTADGGNARDAFDALKDDAKEDGANAEAEGDAEDFEQISDGTFEVDENSRATSAGLQPPDDGTQEGDEPTTSKKAKSSADESADFEEVDANISANAQNAGDETDMLGESDMTLPIDVPEADVSATEKSVTGMDVDNEDDEAEEAAAATPGDVEIPSASNSPEAGGDKEPEEKSTEVGGIEADEEDEEETAGGDADDSKDVAQEDDEEGEEEAVTSKEKEVEEEGGDKDTADHGEDEEAEHEDEPVENVQEPEESDVCLIPDDTETEMTEAEKEQAILARENAEKDADAEEQAEKDKEAAEAAETEEGETTTAAGETSDAEAQAKQAGAEAAAAADSEETAPTTDADLPDPDEPLLEEMQSSTGGESGATAKIIIGWIVSATHSCKQCGEEKACGFRYKHPETSELEYVCEQTCCDAILSANPGKYFIRRKKFLVEELSVDAADEKEAEKTQTVEPDVAEDMETDTEVAAAAAKAMDADDTAATDTAAKEEESRKHYCLQCKETKTCKYFFKQDEESFYICNDDCFNLLSAEEPDKFKLKRHSIRVRNIGATTISSLATDIGTSTKKSTGATGSGAESRVVARTAAEAEAARLERVASFTRHCADCFDEITLGDKNLLWETMDFCNEICLGKYQRTIGAQCQTCNGDVPHQALGKYCVRFGFDIRQFCCAACLNEFKKGLKTCSCCQKDISGGNEGFLAPVGDKEQFKDFCSQACMRRYDTMCNPKKKQRSDLCAVCNNDKQVRVEILLDEKEHTFCSNPCFSAFKFVSNIVADQCGMCCKYFERKGTDAFTIYTERRAKVFCSRICLNVYIIVNRRIVSCQWCKVKKYNFDMIYKQQDAQEILMCSLNCLTLYGVSINAFSRTVANCDNCNNSATPQYHLTMSDASMRNFCTYQCVMQFQSQFARAPLTLDNDAAQPSTQQSSASSTPAATSSSSTGSGTGSKNASTAPFPTGLPKRVKLKVSQQQSVQLKLSNKNSAASNKKQPPPMPVISTVSSLASGETMIGNVTVRRSRGRGGKLETPPPLPGPLTTAVASTNTTGISRGRPRKIISYERSPSPVSLSPPRTSSKRAIPAGVVTSDKFAEKVVKQIETKIIAVPPFPPAMRNVQTNCQPQTITVGFQCTPRTADKATQTDKDYSNKVLLPIPVPVYVPQPMYMYSAPFPVPVPIPLPIPVPVFVPTTRNSAQGIMKEIKKIQEKMPTDPFEAELLMMAEMVAEDKRVSDSDSDDEKPDVAIVSMQYGASNNNAQQHQQQQHQQQQHQQQQQQVEATNNSYGEDVLQMALKMATGEYDQPTTVDLESAMTANTITNPPPGMVGHDDSMSHMSGHHMQQQQHGGMMDQQRGGRGRKRGSMVQQPASPRNNRSPVKRQRLQELETSPQSTPQQSLQPVEKPDANMCLKYTFGVNAWKQWVMTKNADIEKSSVRRRTFKTELLQMTADELNFSLCLFVKEVRKPNGTEYAPDTIYYLVLGIQQYLYENGRIDNIFTDPYYERFTDCLDEVARKFSVLYNDSQYIVTRVEEEHLWECKQLGAHSPHVLLSTLMFFNTKHFNLTTVEEHMQLSFSHIMKHWKRSAQNAKTAGTRNVLLRFYPPQAGLDANPRKKKVYEQQENEENPLRCPVRLYEFYLSKCPESVKTRNDVFYLQPERSCVPDSPVWYSTQALSQESLQKMLHRVKMVKEINIALLTS